MEYDGHITTFVPPTRIYQGGGQLDFDAAGNLLILTGFPYDGTSGQAARLYRISAAQLAAGGAAQLALVAGDIQLTTTPGAPNLPWPSRAMATPTWRWRTPTTLRRV